MGFGHRENNYTLRRTHLVVRRGASLPRPPHERGAVTPSQLAESRHLYGFHASPSGGRNESLRRARVRQSDATKLASDLGATMQFYMSSQRNNMDGHYYCAVNNARPILHERRVVTGCTWQSWDGVKTAQGVTSGCGCRTIR